MHQTGFENELPENNWKFLGQYISDSTNQVAQTNKIFLF